MGKYDFEDTMERWVKEHPREHGLALVVNELRREYLCTNEEGYNVEPCPCEDYEGCLAKPFIQAIRLLEAAGRVGGELKDGLQWLYVVRDGMTFTGLDIENFESFCMALNTMLSALPD